MKFEIKPKISHVHVCNPMLYAPLSLSLSLLLCLVIYFLIKILFKGTFWSKFIFRVLMLTMLKIGKAFQTKFECQSSSNKLECLEENSRFKPN